MMLGSFLFMPLLLSPSSVLHKVLGSLGKVERKAKLKLSPCLKNNVVRQKNTPLRDKAQSLCQPQRSISWRDCRFFTCLVLFKRHGNLISNLPINPSLVRIFIVLKMRLLSPDDA